MRQSDVVAILDETQSMGPSEHLSEYRQVQVKRKRQGSEVSTGLSQDSDDAQHKRKMRNTFSSGTTSLETTTRTSSVLSVPDSSAGQRLKKIARIHLATRLPLFMQDVSCQGIGQRQVANCLSKSTRNVVKDFLLLQCAACTTRSKTSGGCRFQNIRVFVDRERYFLADQSGGAAVTSKGPHYLSVQGSDYFATFLLEKVSSSLKEILAVELKHTDNRLLLRKFRDEDSRAICDGCATTIFSGHWMCYICGRDYCLDCYNEWDERCDLNVYSHINLCKNSKGQGRQVHTKVHMIPYTKFNIDEIERLLSDFESKAISIDVTDDREVMKTIDCPEGRPYSIGSIRETSLAVFQNTWTDGQPLLITSCEDRFQWQWTPEYFMDEYGTEVVEVIDVARGTTLSSTLGEFFEGLRNPVQDSMQHLKLNDWPNVEDFATAAPALFEDFEKALPYPIYTRRKGFLNLAAWFPDQFLPPDLGPKLYCAGASSDADGARGTTVLHMDMTDAVNIMTWSGPRPADRTGSAVWDVFAHQDTDILRTYLLKKAATVTEGSVLDDPIRRPQFYLHAGDLARLKYDYGVVPWRMYQSPGEAVFIPAGCAHQVCNLAPCIKVACDFVSPENVTRSSTIAAADRRLAVLLKREDVLQLKNLLYFSYLGVSEWQQHPMKFPILENPAVEVAQALHKTPLQDKKHQRNSVNTPAIAPDEVDDLEHILERSASTRLPRKASGVAKDYSEIRTDESLQRSRSSKAREPGKKASANLALRKLIDVYGVDEILRSLNEITEVQDHAKMLKFRTADD